VDKTYTFYIPLIKGTKYRSESQYRLKASTEFFSVSCLTALHTKSTAFWYDSGVGMCSRSRKLCWKNAS